ncbi:phage virion morphogenesis protein [Aeromonas sp. BIGb0405]|uniref:phage virion morphogenesis protein n=1 Tax=Aeromonas sp. BIGb0405 TaxID=2940592 RepID=UPI00216865CC|nr:phage virion morphogenesis protein [Aeromonas sp. BIGb0405]MCS3456080.1 phage virion morphogenesis protein [Aeromonas sp. BIGb0405]
MITITLDAHRSNAQLNLLALPPKKRQRLVWRAANEMKKLAARNVRSQQDPNGNPWAPRKRGKRKMLRGLPKLLQIRAPRQDVAELGFKKGSMSVHAGVIAGTHQKGHTYRVNAVSRQRIAPSRGLAGKHASKAQARKLRELGFKRPGKRKRTYRSASLGWITSNLNFAQAGLLIKKLKDAPVKTSWEIQLPARPFLGANAQQRQQAFARALQSIDYGWDVNKHDMKGK